MKPDLRTVLNREIIVGDGAMGTFLYQLGFPSNTSYEELNITLPDVIADVHSQYVMQEHDCWRPIHSLQMIISWPGLSWNPELKRSIAPG